MGRASDLFGKPKVASFMGSPYIVNVTGETLVPNKIFPGFMLGKSLLYAGTNPFYQLSIGKSLHYAALQTLWLVKLWCQTRFFPALCWENPCFMLRKLLFSHRASPVTFTVNPCDYQYCKWQWVFASLITKFDVGYLIFMSGIKFDFRSNILDSGWPILEFF